MDVKSTTDALEGLTVIEKLRLESTLAYHHTHATPQGKNLFHTAFLIRIPVAWIQTSTEGLLRCLE